MIYDPAYPILSGEGLADFPYPLAERRVVASREGEAYFVGFRVLVEAEEEPRMGRGGGDPLEGFLKIA